MKKENCNDNRLLQQIAPCNLLSFGPDTRPLGLENLNVLIGPNGAGKSNLIETLALMRATPRDVREVLRKGGGVTEWIWKGEEKGPATLKLVFNYPIDKRELRHSFSFCADEQGFRLQDERIEDNRSYGNLSKPYFNYRFQQGHPVVNTSNPKNTKTKKERKLAFKSINPSLSILAQFRDPEQYPEISYLAEAYDKVRIYRNWTFGRNTVFREPQKADMRNDRLEEDFSNLGLFLNRLRRSPRAKAEILKGLQDLYEEVSDFDIIVEGGTVQVFFTEGDFTISATRLSDGTLRYLCLLAILCDPDPPSLICIEEPELGLHPDILPRLADHFIAASKRTQLIITTHSDILVDSMTEQPEVVVVCEKHEGCTEMKRLDKEKLSNWIEKYRLGQLWTKGYLGGNRW